MTSSPACIAFEGGKRLAAGAVADVALAVRKRAGGRQPILVFDYDTGRQIDLDLRGTDKDIRTRHAAAAPRAEEEDVAENVRRGPGRPKLGVVPREVTLLPRHWDWLNAQPGGASVALRKLVDEARKARGRADTLRARQEAAYRFMSAIAGNLPRYEDAQRALFGGDAASFSKLTESWPADIRDHARHLAGAAFHAKG
ncbi:MAG TPA: DUF2239 family protein [Hyphomonadaceae bacterium]|nr:DUF2239 family protein [Hyphomonadaceae bacterium]